MVIMVESIGFQSEENGQLVDVGAEMESREFDALLSEVRRRRGTDRDDARELAIAEHFYNLGADHAAS